jgi:hypothetical protein
MNPEELRNVLIGFTTHLQRPAQRRPGYLLLPVAAGGGAGVYLESPGTYDEDIRAHSILW